MHFAVLIQLLYCHSSRRDEGITPPCVRPLDRSTLASRPPPHSKPAHRARSSMCIVHTNSPNLNPATSMPLPASRIANRRRSFERSSRTIGRGETLLYRAQRVSCPALCHTTFVDILNHHIKQKGCCLVPDKNDRSSLKCCCFVCLTRCSSCSASGQAWLYL